MHYIIISNGDFLKRDNLRQCVQHKYVIACDGAADRLSDNDIRYDMIIGDHDSIHAQHPHYHIVDDPMTTDLEKAICYADQHQANTIEIICALGGRVDHLLYNLRLLKKYYRTQRPLYLSTDMQTIFFAKNKTITLKGKQGDYCGIFAFPNAMFSSKGLAYEGDAYPLEFAIQESVSNQLTCDSANITIEGEALIIAPKQTLTL